MKKIFTILIFCLFVINISAQTDSMVIGPGMMYYSIKTSEPQSIKYIKVNLKTSNLKVEAYLAKDVLGTGFETTTSMVRHNTKEGHYVMGAINGDFFGIGDPTDPYGFLSNSMIRNGEYVTGKSSVCTNFSLNENKMPFIEMLPFTGNVKAADSITFKINYVNEARGTNNLVLFNRYFGNVTMTNTYGTEVRIKVIDGYKINTPMKFVVAEKVSNIGNMAINGDYILSGNGTAQTFLDSNIVVGDTITLTLGTNPDRGNLLQLLGGGPRLITDGNYPAAFGDIEGFGSGFSDARNPRTAVGISKDSTYLYLFEIDGRQSFALGMTCSEEAAVMKSAGCWQAVNVDGGGSSTITIRDVFKNSPSDGWERNDGNSLQIVLETPENQFLKNINLLPSYIVMDSTQTKTISTSGTDIYGFPFNLSPSQITWKVEGINGSVDSNGVLSVTNSGVGKIIGTYKTWSDTINVNILDQKIPIWSYSANGGNLPTWLSPTASTERGIAYGKVDGKDRIYVVSRPKILVLDAVTGQQVDTLSTKGISGGSMLLNDVEVSDDGVIFAGNLTTNSSSNPFKIYKWDNEKADPDSVIGFFGSGRYGDKITVKGSYAKNTLTIYASPTSSNKVTKWTMQNGAFTAPQTIILENLTSGGSNQTVCPIGTSSDNFYFNGNNIAPIEYTANGKYVASTPEKLVDLKSSSMYYFESKDKKYLVVYQWGPSNENSVVLDVTDGLAKAFVQEKTKTLGTNANSTLSSGDITARYLGEGLYIYYLLATNNGFASYQLAVGDPISDVKVNNNVTPVEFSLSQNYPNPFNPSTTIKYSLPKSGNIKLYVVNLLGQKVQELLNGYQQAGSYEKHFNGNTLASGVYLYILESPENGLRIVKKMMLIK